MFGTHCHSEPDVELEFGIAGERDRDTQKLAMLYLRPFRDAARSLVVLVGQIQTRSRRNEQMSLPSGLAWSKGVIKIDAPKNFSS